MDKYELIKEIYFNQINHKDSLNSKVSIPVTIESVLIVTLSYYIKLYNIILLKDGQWVGIFRFLVFVLGILIILAVFFSYKSFTGFTYGYLTTDVVLKTEKNSKDYYDKNYEKYYLNTGRSKEELIQKDVEDNLISTMNKCCISNYENNKQKSYMIRINAIILAISILITFIIQLILSVNYSQCLK